MGEKTQNWGKFYYLDFLCSRKLEQRTTAQCWWFSTSIRFKSHCLETECRASDHCSPWLAGMVCFLGFTVLGSITTGDRGGLQRAAAMGREGGLSLTHTGSPVPPAGQRRLWEAVKRRKAMCKRKSWMSKVGGEA